ncbi:MAG: hypothetical protein AABW47_00010 [Nanoarchaeota archaeon]
MEFKEGDLEVLLKVKREKIVRECDLSSYAEILEFRKKVQYWIGVGFVHSEKRSNPSDPFEEEFHYSPTEEGEKYLKSLQPAHQ